MDAHTHTHTLMPVHTLAHNHKIKGLTYFLLRSLIHMHPHVHAHTVIKKKNRDLLTTCFVDTQALTHAYAHWHTVIYKRTGAYLPLASLIFSALLASEFKMRDCFLPSATLISDSFIPGRQKSKWTAVYLPLFTCPDTVWSKKQTNKTTTENQATKTTTKKDQKNGMSEQLLVRFTK